MANIQNIAPALFKVGSLVSLSFAGPWLGKVTVKDEDKEFLELQSQDTSIIEKGKLVLLPKDSFKEFNKIKREASAFVFGLSRTFPIPQARLINNEFIERVDKLMAELKALYLKEARRYAYEQYPQDKAKRTAEIIERYPRFADKIESYYLPTIKIEMACNMEWLFFQVQDIGAFDAVMAEKSKEFGNTMNSFLNEMALDFRKTAVGAALAFKKGMDDAKNTVDNRVVEKFKGFLDRFQQEDFLGDVQMRDILSDIKDKVFAIDQWNVQGNEAALNEIRSYLTQVEALAAVEGAAADIANNFVRSVGGDEIVIEAVDSQQVVGDQTLLSRSDTVELDNPVEHFSRASADIAPDSIEANLEPEESTDQSTGMHVQEPAPEPQPETEVKGETTTPVEPEFQHQ